MKIRKWVRAVGVAASMALMAGGTAMATGDLPISATITNVCSFTVASGVAFGAYDPVVTNKTTDLHSNGSINVTCTDGDTAATVALDVGLHGATPQRNMKGVGAGLLAYNLYSDSGYSTAWTPSTQVPASTAGADGTTPETITVYGSIPHGQNLPADTTYADTVAITVTP